MNRRDAAPIMRCSSGGSSATRRASRRLPPRCRGDVSPRWAADNMPTMTREEIVDIRGMAQVINLFEHCGDRRSRVRRARVCDHRWRGPRLRPPSRGAARGALSHRQTNRRGARVVPRARLARIHAVHRHVRPRDGGAARRAQGESGARAGAGGNPGRVCRADDLSARSASRDRARARSAQHCASPCWTTTTCPTASIRRLPVRASRCMAVAAPSLRSRGRPESGRVAFATPADVSDAELTVSVERDGFNRRVMRADGASIGKDIRQILYANLNS